MNKKGYEPAVLKSTHSTRQEARQAEQSPIEENGGAQSKGDTSGNAINAVGKAPTAPTSSD